MPGPYKVTLLFNHSSVGWSESWYYISNNPFGEADEQAAQKMANARMGLVGSDVNLAAIRWSDVSNPRLSDSFPQGKATDDSGGAPDQAAASWLAIARGPNGLGRRQMWMRSIPDSWIVWDSSTNSWEPQGGLYSALNRFERIVKQTPWALQVVGKKNAAGTNTQPVTAVSGGALGLADLTVADTTGFADTDTLVVSSFKKPLGFLNSTYGPESWQKSAGGIRLNKPISAYTSVGYPGGASVRKRVASYVNITKIRISRPGTRRTGRAFFVPAGRR